MRLSNQSMNVLMMLLTKSLMLQEDIVPDLQALDFAESADGLVVLNPPTLDMSELAEQIKEAQESEKDDSGTDGA